jgi:hypothetical protein
MHAQGAFATESGHHWWVQANAARAQPRHTPACTLCHSSRYFQALNAPNFSGKKIEIWTLTSYKWIWFVYDLCSNEALVATITGGLTARRNGHMDPTYHAPYIGHVILWTCCFIFIMPRSLACFSFFLLESCWSWWRGVPVQPVVYFTANLP